MPKKEPLFQELIDILARIYEPKDIKNDTFDNMINATLILGVMHGSNKGADEKTCLQAIKINLNKHIDLLIKDCE